MNTTAEHKADTSTWDQLYSNADEQLARQRLDKERRARRWRVLRDYLEQTYPGQTLDTVELGCGGGDLSALLAELGHRVTLVDFSEAALGHARDRFAAMGLPAEFELADIFALHETHAGRFDLSVSLGVAEHFSGKLRQDMIDAHHHVLRSGGTAFISVPNARCVPYRLWKAYLHLRDAWPYGYEAPYRPGELREAAERAGMYPAHTYQTGFAAAVDGCLILPMTGRRLGWGDGPHLLNRLGGWDVNLIARSAA